MGLRKILSRITAAFSPTPGTVLPPDTALLSRATFVPAGFENGVEILNDHKTPMGFVVEALSTHAGLDKTDAVRAMLEVHEKGGKLLPTSTYERAVDISAALQSEATKAGHPFVCRAVRRELPPNNSFERTREG